MNLTEAILALGNDYDTSTKMGQAAELWATGIHAFVYKKRGEDFGFPFVRLEVDGRTNNLTSETLVMFQVLDDSGDKNPTRVEEILEQIGRLFQHTALEVAGMCWGDMWETARRTEGREGIWEPEIEFTVSLIKT